MSEAMNVENNWNAFQLSKLIEFYIPPPGIYL